VKLERIDVVDRDDALRLRAEGDRRSTPPFYFRPTRR
jgi:hypothetical protein